MYILDRCINLLVPYVMPSRASSQGRSGVAPVTG